VGNGTYINIYAENWWKCSNKEIVVVLTKIGLWLYPLCIQNGYILIYKTRKIDPFSIS
jgi:hypothetical protein